MTFLLQGKALPGEPLRLATGGSDAHVVIWNVKEGDEGKVHDSLLFSTYVVKIYTARRCGSTLSVLDPDPNLSGSLGVISVEPEGGKRKNFHL